MKAKDLQNTLEETLPLHVQLLFKFGCDSLEDDPRNDRSRYTITPEMIAKVHYFVLEDRRLKLREISEAVGISCE